MPVSSPLLKIFYVSRCADAVTPTAVRAIVGASQRRNRRADVTGVLAYTGHHFAQVIEGRPVDVESLISSIASDPRHEGVRIVLRQEHAPSRDFTGWSMHLLDSPDLDASVAQLLSGGADGVSLASQTLDRITAMARWDACDDEAADGGTVPHPDAEQTTQAAIEDTVFGLLATRHDGATICPSEVARALVAHEGRWRELMPQVRQVAQRLAEEHRLDVTRGGVQVDATSRGGPIRLGRPVKRNDGS
jgi:hypothetical protein